MFYKLIFLVLQFWITSTASQDWSVTLFTGARYLSGTTADINLEINGDLAVSDTIVIKPSERIRSNSVSTFNFNVNKNIGNVISITIHIKPLIPLIYDWNLYKAILTDSSNRSYIFDCDCWFKYASSRRTLYPTKQNKETLPGIDRDHMIENSQFSLAVGLLTILTFVIVFAYISNILRKRWRNRVTLINMRQRNIQLSRANEANVAPENSQQHQVTLIFPASDAINTQNTSLLNDKQDSPPEYKDLFPTAAWNKQT